MGGGHSNNKKAFTLIELLAIIVIIGFIAVITIPIILNVIEKAKKGSVIDSAYHYNDAVNKSIANQLAKNPTMSMPVGIYTLDDNNVFQGTGSFTVDVNGTAPSSGSWIEIIDGEVVNFSLGFGEYVVTKYDDTEVTATKGTTIALKPEDRKIEIIKNLAFEKATNIIKGNDDKSRLFENDIDGTSQKEWVAKYNEEIEAYSLKVEAYNTWYVVTKNGDEISVEENGNIGDKTTYENRIFAHCKDIATEKLNSIIAQISSDDIKSAMLTQAQSDDDDVSIKISDINGIISPSKMDSDSWAFYSYTKGDSNVELTNYSISVIEGGYTFVSNMIDKSSNNVELGILNPKKKTTKVSHIVNGIKYYNTEWIGANPIYLDPTAQNGLCTETEYNNNNDKLGTAGCMKWYAYSENADGTVNMILDHDTDDSWKMWISPGDYCAGEGIPTQAIEVGITYPNISAANPYGIFNTNNVLGDEYYSQYGNWNKGPITFLKTLKSHTSNWINESISRNSYGTYTNRNKFFNENNPNNENYTINYNGYNARLITAQEVGYIVGSNFDERIDAYFYIDKNIYWWLADNLKGFGYWTASASYYYSRYASVMYVGNESFGVHAYHPSGYTYSNWGMYLRPVITVSSSVISGS